jgi:tetratricopeptide (TPR) repeat protein
MRFFKRFFVGIAREFAAIFRVVSLLRWQAWTAWAGLFALSLAGTLPMHVMLAVQCSVVLSFGLVALMSGRVAAFIRRRRWVRLPDGRKVVPYLPQLVMFAAFPLFFSAMTVLFWKAAQVQPHLLPAGSWGEALLLATNNFLRCQFFFDAAEIFHFWLGPRAWPAGAFGPSLLLVCRVLMDVVFLKLAFKIVMAGYYRAQGLGRGEDNLVHLREALSIQDAPRVQQLSQTVRRAMCRTVDALVEHLQPRAAEFEASQRAWLSLRSMKDFALPYLEDRLRPNREEGGPVEDDDLAPPPEMSPEDCQRLRSIVRTLRQSEAITEWRQLEPSPYIRVWPYFPLGAILLSGIILPHTLPDARWSLLVSIWYLLLAAWMLLDARRWINRLLLSFGAIRPYWPGSLPWLLARWSLAMAPLLICSAAAMFYFLEQVTPVVMFTGPEGEPLIGRLGLSSAFHYVGDNLLRTNIFFDSIELYDLKPTTIETYHPLSCIVTLITRMIFDLGILSLWGSVVASRFNHIFTGTNVLPHMELKIQLEAQENGQRSSRFVLYYYRHLREFFLTAMEGSLDNRKLLAALGHSGFLSALKGRIDAAHSKNALHARHRANLGFALTQQGRLQEAIDEERHAVQLLEQLQRQGHLDAAKDLAGAKLDLAVAHETQGRWNAAVTRYYEAIELFERLLREDHRHVEGDYSYTLNCLAWLLATCPDGRHRDGLKAVMYAERACELTGWTDIDYLDTLAAAYAEVGEFERAAELQRRVCEDPTDQVDQVDFESRLNLYLDSKPYHRQPMRSGERRAESGEPEKEAES